MKDITTIENGGNEMSDLPTPETDLLYLKQRPSIVQMTTHFNQFVKKCKQLERERDKANEDLHKQLVQYDQLFDEAEKIRIERDEARDKAERYRLEANAMMMQRDEARDVVKILCDQNE